MLVLERVNFSSFEPDDTDWKLWSFDGVFHSLFLTKAASGQETAAPQSVLQGQLLQCAP